MGAESNSSGNLTRAMAEAGSVLPGYLAVILSVLMVTLVVVVVAGNALVIMAFVVDKTLRNQSNYFFLNLAISDFLVGELPPFSFIMSSWQGAKIWLLFLHVIDPPPLYCGAISILPKHTVLSLQCKCSGSGGERSPLPVRSASSITHTQLQIWTPLFDSCDTHPTYCAALICSSGHTFSPVKQCGLFPVPPQKSLFLKRLYFFPRHIKWAYRKQRGRREACECWIMSLSVGVACSRCLLHPGVHPVQPDRPLDAGKRSVQGVAGHGLPALHRFSLQHCPN